jgi:hypothetical protein
MDRDLNTSTKTITLICGDLNLSALPIGPELKEMIIKYKPTYASLVEIFD